MEEYCRTHEINLTKLDVCDNIYFYELSRKKLSIIVNKRFEIIAFPNCENIIQTNLSSEFGVDILECFIFYETLFERLIGESSGIELFYEKYSNYMIRVVLKASYKEQLVFEIHDIERLNLVLDLFPLVFYPRRLSLTFVD